MVRSLTNARGDANVQDAIVRVRHGSRHPRDHGVNMAPQVPDVGGTGDLGLFSWRDRNFHTSMVTVG